MLISEFYKDQVLFITGGSGFIGKALIEKMLRSCPDIAKIYFLIRVKKGKTAQERLELTLRSACFRRLWQERPEAFKKIQPIEGNCRDLQLGISQEDLERIRDVSIVIHSAATVRFQEPLHEAILMNTRGTLELLRIAENLPNLKAFVHISTTYSNPAEMVIHEKVYEPVMDWRSAIKFAENVDEDILSILTPKIGTKHPNTYTFTKNLGEQIVLEYKDKLPIAMLRPSIIMSSLEEPIPGWIDNVNGPIGMLIACGTGLKRSELCDPQAIVAIVPIDIVVRAIIISVYKTGIENMCSKNSEMDIPIYNCAINSVAPITIEQIIHRGEKFVKHYPLEKMIWAPGGVMYKIKLFYLLQVLLQQVPMAIFLDGLLCLYGKKPMIVKLQRTFVNASKALQYFMSNSWTFKTENFFALENLVTNEEKEDFGFLTRCYVDYDKWYPNLIRGMREFILNETPDPSPSALKRIKVFRVLNFITQCIFLYLVLNFLFRWLFL